MQHGRSYSARSNRLRQMLVIYRKLRTGYFLIWFNCFAQSPTNGTRHQIELLRLILLANENSLLIWTYPAVIQSGSTFEQHPAQTAIPRYSKRVNARLVDCTRLMHLILDYPSLRMAEQTTPMPTTATKSTRKQNIHRANERIVVRLRVSHS